MLPKLASLQLRQLFTLATGACVRACVCALVYVCVCVCAWRCHYIRYPTAIKLLTTSNFKSPEETKLIHGSVRLSATQVSYYQ